MFLMKQLTTEQRTKVDRKKNQPSNLPAAVTALITVEAATLTGTTDI